MPHVQLNWQITKCLAFRRTQITCIDGELFTSFWECLLIWNDFPQAYRRLHVFFKIVSDLFHKYKKFEIYLFTFFSAANVKSGNTLVKIVILLLDKAMSLSFRFKKWHISSNYSKGKETLYSS